MDAVESPSKILIVLHQESSTPGRVGRLLRRQGFVLDVRRPSLGDALPDTLADHAGAVMFGGPMSANDPDAYIRREIDWIGVPLKQQKPFLGICLGAQMLSKHLGERVYRHPQGRVEIGYYPIQPTPEFTSLCETFGGVGPPNHVYHWHREGFDLPRGSCLLAGGDDFPIQAFREGPAAYGFQFHPEVTYAMMCRWTTRAADRMLAPGAKGPRTHLEGWFRYDAAISRWTESFLRGWASQQPGVHRPNTELALTA